MKAARNFVCFCKRLFFFFCLASILLPYAGNAAESRGVQYPDSILLQGEKLSIRGIGLLRWKYFFKVYQVALYLPPEAQTKDALKDIPKRLEYYFFVDMKAEDFQTTGMPLMVRNVGKEKAELVSKELDTFNGFYQNVKSGQRYTITYEPGRGTSLALEGKELGVVPGTDFGAAYFSIWLGPDPVSKELREGLFDPASVTLSNK